MMEILQKRLLTAPSGYDASLLMHFDGNLKDSSKNHHRATITQGAGYFSFSGTDTPQNLENFDKHLYVAAGNGRIQIPHHESLALGTVWQIDFRVRSISSNIFTYKFSIEKQNNFGFWLGMNSMYYSLYNSSGEAIRNSSISYDIGKNDSDWYSVSIISTGTQFRIYTRNSILVNTDIKPNVIYGTAPLVINSRDNTSDYRIDELRILKGRYEIPTAIPTTPYR